MEDVPLVYDLVPMVMPEEPPVEPAPLIDGFQKVRQLVPPIVWVQFFDNTAGGAVGQDKDLNAMLPYLSAYMGHAQLSDTYYYIHLVPGLMEEMSDFAFSSAEVLLPEVETNE